MDINARLEIFALMRILQALIVEMVLLTMPLKNATLAEMTISTDALLNASLPLLTLAPKMTGAANYFHVETEYCKEMKHVMMEVMTVLAVQLAVRTLMIISYATLTL